LIAALWPIWYWRTAWQEGGAWLQQLLAAPTASVATVGRAKALRCAAIMAHFEGKLGSARTLFEESAAYCRQIGNQRSLAYTLIGVSVTLRDRGDYAAAHQGLIESQRFFAAASDQWGAALGNNELGRIAMSQGDYGAAQRYFSASLAHARALHDDWGVIYLLHNLLALALCQRDEIAAHRYYAEILAIHALLAPHGPQMHALQAMTLGAYILGDVVAWSAHFVDDYPTAVALFTEQLAVSRERGDEQLTARLLNHLGDVIRATGDHAHALTLYQQSLALFLRLDLPAGVALAFHNLGHIHLQQGNLVEATAKFVASLRIYLASEILWNQADCLVGLAGVAAAQHEFVRAAELLGAAHALQRAVDVSGAYASPTIRRTGAQIRAAVQQKLPAAAWATAHAAGMDLVTQDRQAWLAALVAGHAQRIAGPGGER
jgi:tetratricopeptide (TPR) repeat protein